MPGSLVGDHRLQNLGLDAAGADGIDPDVMRRQRQCHAPVLKTLRQAPITSGSRLCLLLNMPRITSRGRLRLLKTTDMTTVRVSQALLGYPPDTAIL